jgi:hypothetical protein
MEENIEKSHKTVGKPAENTYIFNILSFYSWVMFIT